jgi:Concanavalin A-like lectin/glucanases superfamily
VGVPTLKVEIAFPVDVLEVPDSLSKLDPKTISGLVGWYDFTDTSSLFTDTARTTPVTGTGQAIAGVTDKSGAGNHLTQATAGSRPTYTVGAKRSAVFDGGDFLSAAANSYSQPLTIILAGRQNATNVTNVFVGGVSTDLNYSGVNSALWQMYAGTAQTATGADNSWHAHAAVYNGASSTLEVDAVTKAIGGTVGTNALNVIRLGGTTTAPTGNLTGELGQVFIFNRALSAMERRVVVRSLGFTFGLALGGSDWTDVSTWARRVSLSRGRDHELSRSQAGTAQIALSNLDRRFDPLNSASPYWPYVIPMRQVRVSAVWSSVTYFLFTGFIEDWGPTWLPRPIRGSGDAEARISAVDGFKVLSLYEMAGSGVYETAVLADDPEDYWRLTEPAGASTVIDDAPGDYNNDLTVNGSQVTLGTAAGPLSGGQTAADFNGTGNSPLRRAAANVWQNDATATYYDICCDFWVKPDSLNPTSAVGLVHLTGAGTTSVAGALEVLVNQTGTIVVEWRENGSGNPGQQRGLGSSPGKIQAGVWTHVGIIRAGNYVEFWFNGEFDTSSTFFGAGPYGGIPAGTTPCIVIGGEEGSSVYFDGKLAHVAIYDGPLPGTAFGAHGSASLGGTGTATTSGSQIGFLLDSIGWPAERRVLDVGDANMGVLSVSGSILESILSIGEDAEQGLVQISNGGNVIFHSRQSVLGGHTTTVATFADDGTGTRYVEMGTRYDDGDIYTQVIAQGNFEGASEQIATAATVARFGPRVLSKTGLKLATDADIGLLANMLASRYDSPALRVTRIGLPMVADADWPTILQIDTHHAKVALIRTPPGGGSPISGNAHVEGVRWEINPAEGTWAPSFSLVPAFEDEFWTLGTSAFDDETVMGW